MLKASYNQDVPYARELFWAMFSLPKLPLNLRRLAFR